MSNFRVHHGLQDFADVPDVAAALDLVKGLLESGRTNVLITEPDMVVTGNTDYDDKRGDGRVGTLVLEIPLGPPGSVGPVDVDTRR